MNAKTILLLLTTALTACGDPDIDGLPATGGSEQTNNTTTEASTATQNTTNTGSTNGATTGTTGTTTPTETVGFSEVYDRLIAEGGCSAGYCHGSAVASADLMYDFLVDREGSRETTCDATLLVSPGNPDASILWYRVRPASMDDGAPCATKMPSGTETGLSEGTAMVVHDWILAGAPR